MTAELNLRYREATAIDDIGGPEDRPVSDRSALRGNHETETVLEYTGDRVHL